MVGNRKETKDSARARHDPEKNVAYFCRALNGRGDAARQLLRLCGREFTTFFARLTWRKSAHNSRATRTRTLLAALKVKAWTSLNGHYSRALLRIGTVLLEDMSIPPVIQQYLWNVDELEAAETASTLGPRKLCLWRCVEWGRAARRSASKDQTLKVWDVAAGRELRTLPGRTGVVNGVALSRDGSADSASRDQTLKVWDVGRGRELRTL